MKISKEKIENENSNIKIAREKNVKIMAENIERENNVAKWRENENNLFS